MAATKKARRKTGTSAKAQIKVAGKVYKKKSCFLTKTAAKAAAKKIRSTGQNARVVERCVFVRGRAKKKAA